MKRVSIANDTLYGLGAGVWTRTVRVPTAWAVRSRQAGCGPTATTPIPRHAAFGGYKRSGIGRETHRMMLDHYQQTKNLLVSYSAKKLGSFDPVKAGVGGRAHPRSIFIRQEKSYGEDDEGCGRARIRRTADHRRSPGARGRRRHDPGRDPGFGGVPYRSARAEGDWPVKPNTPFIPGHEGVGYVSAVGKGVKQHQGRRPGGRAMALHRLRHCVHCLGGWETLCESQLNTGYSVNGGFADYVIADPNFVGHLPPISASPRSRRCCARGDGL